MIIAMTGHRPNKLWGYNTANPNYSKVKDALNELIDTHHIDTLISGMALGLDQLAAEVAEERYDVKCIAAVPFRGQESKWPYLSRHHYFQLLDKADEIHIISEGAYSPAKMQIRNEWMVDHADMVVALWDGTPGGTKNCIDYAIRQNKTIMRLDPKTVTPNKPAHFTLYHGPTMDKTPIANDPSDNQNKSFEFETHTTV